ncbi:hypothetical protein SAMN05421848_0505 [Kushneria avicenniae]|uniref:Uncharacterized protein n=1 Tax=Kushneria avicenniae TaxID=402385 RepID=A0A1I1GCB2_9GAMM|nr:hypothetical protein SAMN05421848_0505 [Kushneria avicenniae]
MRDSVCLIKSSRSVYHVTGLSCQSHKCRILRFFLSGRTFHNVALLQNNGSFDCLIKGHSSLSQLFSQ